MLACAGLASTPALGQTPGGAEARLPPGRAAGPPSVLAVVERFDMDGDGRLDAAERTRAMAWLASYRVPDGVGGRGAPDLAPSAPGPRLAPAEVPSFPGAPLYDPGTLRTIFLEFESPDWERELAAFYRTDVEVPATVIVDGERYPDVGVRFRGASSFLGVPEGSKRSLNLSVNFVHPDRRIGGYRTLNLLNAHNDPTFVRTALYSEVARRYLAIPRVNFVRVVINGESWGAYLSAQQFNRDFLADFFGTGDGARWKVPGSPNGRGGMEYFGDDPDAYRRLYDIRSRDDPERWQELIALFRVLDRTPAGELEAALEPILDVDGVLRFLAVEIALVNSDGYWARASDYHIYQEPGGRFHVVPHDFNEAFGVRGAADLDPLVSIDDPAKPLYSKLLAAPALRERYLAYVREIAERWLDPAALAPLIEQYRTLIEEDVRRDTRKLYSFDAFEAGFEELYRFLEERRAYLLGEP